MNSEEFRAEMHEYIDKAFDEILEYQQVITEIFNEFHRICIKNDITYYTAYGSLLAVERDASLIVPWDKDVDVLLPITQKELLHEALQRDLSDDFFFTSNDIDKDYRLLMLRVGKKGYDLETFHLDVYYQVGAPDSKMEQEKMKRKIKKLLRQHELKTSFKRQKIIVSLYGKPHIYISAIIYKIKSLFYPVESNLKKICNAYPFDSSNYYITIGDGAEIFPKSIFEPRHLAAVKNVECFVPDDVEQFLALRYGDYTSYLPISARFDEFYCGYKDATESVKQQRIAASRDFIL